MNKPKLLVVADAPTVSTGFAQVTRNLCSRWRPYFKEPIDIWGVNFSGFPHDLPYRIYPAGYQDWNSTDKLSQLLNRILAGDYTHIFILCDAHMLSLGNFPQVLRQICDQKKIHLTHYFPVDAPLEKKWLELASQADCAVTYTEFGRQECNRVRPGFKPDVLGHGVDRSVYFPREDRMSIRQHLLKGWVKDDEYLIVNVNRNERRKAPHHSLQIIKRLRHVHHIPGVKLLLHMPNLNEIEGTELEAVANQLGLTYEKHWKHSDDMFHHGNSRLPEDGLNELYNAADMVLSTSLGEGWGLSLIEGSAAGCRIACPDHTSCGEIARCFDSLGQTGQFTLLPVSEQCIVNPLDSSRVRYPVDVVAAAQKIADVIKSGPPSGPNTQGGRFVLNDATREWLAWDRIATEFLRLMKVI